MHFSSLAKFLFFCFSNGCLEKSDGQVAVLVVLRFEFSGFTLSTAGYRFNHLPPCKQVVLIEPKDLSLGMDSHKIDSYLCCVHLTFGVAC